MIVYTCLSCNHTGDGTVLERDRDGHLRPESRDACTVCGSHQLEFHSEIPPDTCQRCGVVDRWRDTDLCEGCGRWLCRHCLGLHERDRRQCRGECAA